MSYIKLGLIAATVIIAGCASESPDQMPNNEENTNNIEPNNTNQSSEISDSNTEENTVTYTDSGFSPETITIEQGETVTWESEGSTMWVASDQHPLHTEYSDTSRTEHCSNGDQTEAAFDQCSASSSFSFTFEKTGEWDYHNHESSFHYGTVIVE